MSSQDVFITRINHHDKLKEKVLKDTNKDKT